MLKQAEHIDDLVDGRIPEMNPALDLLRPLRLGDVPQEQLVIPSDAVVCYEKGKRVIRKERRATPRIPFCVPIQVEIMGEDDVAAFENLGTDNPSDN